MDLLLAVPFGVAIGAVVGTVGGGGAILALPILVYPLGQGVSSASTASLVVVAMAASAGAGIQARHGHLCRTIALAFSAPAAIGAYIGTVAGGAVSPRALILAFVPVMAAAAAITYVRGGQVGDDTAEDDGCPDGRLGTAAASGLLVGVMTGFFGVGGGFLIVPALTTLIMLPMRRAIATSLAIVTLTGLAALASHLARGADPDWPLTLLLCAGAIAGAALGSIAGRRLSPLALSRAFALVVAAVSAFLLVDVLVLGGPPTG
jgi:uncharacterized membrane protein YfcA